jgi:hypothetical protein
MDINKWKSLAVAINSWRDLWAMKNLADYKYLRPGNYYINFNRCESYGACKKGRNNRRCLEKKIS